MNIAQEDGVEERSGEGSGQINLPNPTGMLGMPVQIILQNPCKGWAVRAGVEIRTRGIAQGLGELIQKSPVFHQIEGTGKTGKDGGV